MAGAGFDPHLGPGFVPLPFRIGRRIGGEDGAVELFVDEAQLGRALVVESDFGN